MGLQHSNLYKDFEIHSSSNVANHHFLVSFKSKTTDFPSQTLVLGKVRLLWTRVRVISCCTLVQDHKIFVMFSPIVKILNLYIILLCTHLSLFFQYLSITCNAFITCYIRRKKYLIGNYQK